MKNKLIPLLIGAILLTVLLGVAQPAQAYELHCIDPDNGPMVCYYDFSAAEYCTLYLPSQAPLGSNPVAYWDPKTETCYFHHDSISCDPYFNVLGGLYKLYTPTGSFMDDTGRYVWFNSISACASLGNPETGSFPNPTLVHIEAGGTGTVKIQTGSFTYDYGTCSGLCRVGTVRMTPPATRALELLPYRVYRKAYVTILNDAGELAQGTFRLCYNLEYNENKNPAFFRFNGTDWSYYGGFWNLSQTKFCMYSEVSGNYVMVELGQN